ncbi:hypothetical protein DVS28_b0446 (plasmid) [Euzebya pacifica]|uniref:Uncharacterized protein n=1 Tax=Euzebya pacifica TaxID=1608957 RepID=A0A346Y6T9_9ACTN|nr:hypothetical protein [Euzebya pacifica]AXV10186.1 hypothetical protein DVS28_b0446 [Euzebya pacifica]
MLLIGPASGNKTLRPVDGHVDVGGIEVPYRRHHGETEEEAMERAAAAFMADADTTSSLTSGV